MKKLATLILCLAASLPTMAQTAAGDTIPARFPGGDKAMKAYIEANRKYPFASLRNGIEGVVDVSFTVMPDGSREQLSIVRLVDPDLEAEAIRLVNDMPAWTPATVEGRPVESDADVQVEFVLPE